MNVINAQNLSKRFGTHEALSDINFALPAGESLSVVGPNGSGKTTLVRCLLGLLAPSGGLASISGKPYSSAHHVRVGYLPEERGNFQRDSPLDVLRLFGRLRGLNHKDASTRSYEYLEEVGLMRQARSRIQTLSNGQQQKVHLGLTFIADPDLLVLDEPTRGFDPVNQGLFRDHLQRHLQRGATLLLVTNQMHEVEELTKKVLFLRKGRLHFFGQNHSAKEHLGRRTTEVTYTGQLPKDIERWNLNVREPGKAVMEQEHGLHDANRLLAGLLAAGVEVTDFNSRLANFEEIFMSIYGDSAATGSLVA
ncbi:ABC transporter ATP-binding protein [Paenarthrobacter sp. NPDC090520]|uniref:ABC transporter ATP-binding protein n=1 Tax=Paenarthrobacter sp. NPDC090520 TaxID=3364382 RepID=UPI0037F52F1E